MDDHVKLKFKYLKNGEILLDTSDLKVGDVIEVMPENMDLFEKLRLDGGMYPFEIIRYGVLSGEGGMIVSYMFKVVAVDKI